MIEPNVGMDPTIPARAPQANDPAPSGAKEFKLFGEKGFSFFDLLDIVNPLQHIPIISTIYRKLTGDELSPGARIAGATLFGGPIGAAVALVDTAVEHNTGRDMGATAMAALTGDDGADFNRDGATTILAAAGSPRLGFADADLGDVSGQPTFLAAAVPDLGALSGFDAGADHAPARQNSPLQLDPRFAVESWQPPARSAAAQTSPMAQTNNVGRSAQAAQPALIEAQAARAAQMALSKGETGFGDLSSGLPNAKDYDDAAAVELNVAARRIKPYPSDIPKGAASSLSRNAMRAYARSMDLDSAAPSNAPSNPANATPTPERAVAAAQNDWIIDAMARAMAKYQAGHRLQSGAAQPAMAVSR